MPRGLLDEDAVPGLLDQVGSKTSAFQRQVYALTPQMAANQAYMQRLIQNADSDADLRSLQRKLQGMGFNTAIPIFEGL